MTSALVGHAMLHEGVSLTPVFPVLPSFSHKGSLDLDKLAAYVRFLASNGANCLMTTSGTTQFNLLTAEEILELNTRVREVFHARLILGAPALSEQGLAPFLDQTFGRQPGAEVLLIYPERLYSEREVVGFFARSSRRHAGGRFLIHGRPFSGVRGGLVDYSPRLAIQILRRCPNVVGFKEETSSYEKAFEFSACVASARSTELIVAGGSMRRGLLLSAAGAQKFLSGVGSLFPHFELAFARHMRQGALRAAVQIINLLETPLFTVFFEVGWHKALRFAAKHLGLIGGGERLPMTPPDRCQRRSIEKCLETIGANAQRLAEEGVL